MSIRDAAKSLGSDFAGSAAADVVTHPFLAAIGLGGHRHDGKPSPIAEAFGSWFKAQFTEKAERRAALPEVRRHLMTLLVPYWTANALENLRCLHETAMARELKFKKGNVEISFDEDDLVDLVGTFVFKVEIEEHIHKETKKEGKRETVHEETTRKRVVRPRGKEELYNMEVKDFLVKLDNLAADPDKFFQILYGLKDDGLSQNANRVGDEAVRALNAMGEIRLFGCFGPRIVQGTRPQVVPTGTDPDADEPVPEMPKKGFFEPHSIFIVRYTDWMTQRDLAVAKNAERARCRSARSASTTKGGVA